MTLKEYDVALLHTMLKCSAFGWPDDELEKAHALLDKIATSPSDVKTLLGPPVGEVCAPNGSRPYAHFQRTGDVGELPVGAKLYAVTDDALVRGTK